MYVLGIEEVMRDFDLTYLPRFTLSLSFFFLIFIKVL
jgi:hypothetical protein